MVRSRIARASLYSIAAAGLATALLVQTATSQPVRGSGQPGAGGRMATPMPGMQGMGQPGFMPGSFRHLLEPDYHMRDGALLAQGLELDRGQRPIVELLLEDYRAAYEEAATDLRDAVRRTRMPRFGPAMAGFGRGGAEDAERPRPSRVIEFDGADLQDIEVADGRVRVFVGGSAEGAAAIPGGVIVRRMGEDGEAITISLDDADLPEEVRERMERVRRQIEERIEQRREAIEQARREAAERAEELGEPLEPSEVVAIAQDFLVKKEALRIQLEQDIASLLSPDQLEAWPEAIALVRRINRVQLGRLSGEQIDLTAIVRDLRLPDFLYDQIEPLLRSYVLDLDAALEERARMLDRADIEMFLALHAQDWDRMLAIDEQISTRRIAVRDANDRHAEHIAASIEPEEWRTRFQDEVRAQAHPWTVRPTPFERQVAAALEHEDLLDEHREALDEVVARYNEEMAAAVEQGVRQLQETEHLRFRQMIEIMQQIQSGEQPAQIGRGMFGRDDPRRDRMSIAMRYMRELRNILPEDMLPQGRQFFSFD